MIGSIPQNSGARQTVTSKIMISPLTRQSSSNGSNRIRPRVIRTFALAVLASACVACGMGYSGKGSLASSLGRPDITGRVLLVGDQREPLGYGLYSYVLFDSEPTPETEPLYLAVILACLEEVQDLGELEKKYTNSLSKLNALFIPVTENIAEAKGPQPEQAKQTLLQTKAAEILHRYNYPRAKAILKRLSPIRRHGGPYLVSGLAPASDNNNPTISLFQDLAVVHFVSSEKSPNKMAREWVLDFIGRVSTLRPTDWSSELLKGFAEEMQDAQRPSFIHHKVRTDQSDVEKWIAIVFQPEDNSSKRTFLLSSWKSDLHNRSPVFITHLDQ